MENRLQSITVASIVVLLLGALSAEGQISDVSNIIQVAKDGPAFHSIQAALDSITDASEVNPYLVSVAPGIYEERVRLKDYVVVRGQGRQLTTIRFEGYYALKTVGSGPKELRSLTVECIGGRGGCIHNPDALMVADVTVRAIGAKPVAIEHRCGDLTLKDVSLEVLPDSTAKVCGGKGIAHPDRFAGCWFSGDLLLDDVSILFPGQDCSNSGIGIDSRTSNLKMSNSEIITKGDAGSIGILAGARSHDLTNVRILAEQALRLRAWGGDVRVRYSDVTGSIEIGLLEPETEGVVEPPSVRLFHSHFNGQVSSQWGVVSCFASCTDSMMPLDENCEPIP